MVWQICPRPLTARPKPRPLSGKAREFCAPASISAVDGNGRSPPYSIAQDASGRNATCTARVGPVWAAAEAPSVTAAAIQVTPQIDVFTTDTPTAVLVRQVLGAV